LAENDDTTPVCIDDSELVHATLIGFHG